MSLPPSPLEDRVDSGRPSRVSCRLPWPCDKLIFHLNACCSEHWCKGYYPECPSGLANSVRAACRGTSKKWKVHKKTKYVYYFLLNGLLYPRLHTWNRRVCVCYAAAFQSYWLTETFLMCTHSIAFIVSYILTSFQYIKMYIYHVHSGDLPILNIYLHCIKTSYLFYCRGWSVHLEV